LSKDKAELLASIVKERNLLESDVKDWRYRMRNTTPKILFRLGGSIVFCYDINGLFKGLKQENGPSDWRLFIDPSQ
jgi:hypothetical protein